MSTPTAPIINPHPDPALIAALAGDDLEHTSTCWTCRGTGKIHTGSSRDSAHTCPMCRGEGYTPRGAR